MADWFVGRDSTLAKDYGQDTGTSAGTSIESSSIHTKTAWVQLSASTDYEADGFLFFRSKGIGSANETLWDVGVGAEGSEQVIVPNLLFANRAPNDGQGAYIPLSIPAGSRVSARYQIASSSTITHTVALVLLKGGFLGLPGLSRMEDCGADTTNSKGMVIDPGDSVNQKGSWVELRAASSFAYRSIIVAIGHNNFLSKSDDVWLFDIGVGGSGSEQVIIPNLMLGTSLAGDHITPNIIGPLPFSVPAGSRIAVRAQSSTTGSIGRLFTCCVYGLG